MLKRPGALCACLLCAAVFLLGLVRLFELRFERGDIFPPYSTLRTDPLGASVLYESLDRVPGLSTRRYFEQTFTSDDGRAHALFVLGAPAEADFELPRGEFDTLQRFVYNGGRLVIAYAPRAELEPTGDEADTEAPDQPTVGEKRSRRHRQTSEAGAPGGQSQTNRAGAPDPASATNRIHATNQVSKPWHPGPRHNRRRPNSPEDREPTDQPDDEDPRDELLHYTELSKEWGFQLQMKSLETNDDGQIQFPPARRLAALPDLPSVLVVHTALCFTNLTNGWSTVYQRDPAAPVLVERRFGAGTVVLVADAYPLSNEAMFKDRSPALLAWLLGGGREVTFDEAHLGLVEQPGMATLMRRYRLHGLVLSLLLAAGLFVWKNSVSLVPPPPETEAGDGPTVVGRDSASGFVNLARRGIAPPELINVCFAEWKTSSPRFGTLSPAQRRDVERLVREQAALEPHLRRPVENYRVLSQLLQRRI